jgi:hypothetical protein
MPLTVFDIKGLPRHHHELIEAASSRMANTPKDRTNAWISADRFKSSFRVLITGSHGFERTVMFALVDRFQISIAILPIVA